MTKGKYIRTKEIREKCRKSQLKLGKKISEEHKKRISQFNKGKIVSLETREKIRKALTGIKRNPLSEEHRRKLSIAQKGHICYTLGRKRTEEEKRKVSEKLKGRKMSKETRNKMSLAQSGKYHPNWKGGISFRDYSPLFNPRFKRLIRKRDNQVCMLCGIHREKLNRSLDVHHVNYDKQLTIPENCISLCDICHRKTNSNKESWIIFFQSLLSKKYGYKYEDEKPFIEFKIPNNMKGGQ